MQQTNPIQPGTAIVLLLRNDQARQPVHAAIYAAAGYAFGVLGYAAASLACFLFGGRPEKPAHPRHSMPVTPPAPSAISAHSPRPLLRY